MSSVVNKNLLNMKSLFYQPEFIREFILVFLSSVWDVCRSYAQHTDTNLDTFAFTLDLITLH